MGMTIIEKILARASGVARIAPGDLAVVDVDLVVMIDLSFSRASWREVLKVHDSEKVVVVFDHDVPASNRSGVHASFEEGQTVEVSIADWTVRNRDSGAVLAVKPVPERLLSLMISGGIYPLLEAEGLIAPKEAAQR